MKIAIAQDKCRCKDVKLCVRVCPYGFIWDTDRDSPPVMKAELEHYCIDCGHCETVCPSDAIRVAALESPAVPFDKKLKITEQQAATLLKTRRSVRTFKEEALPQETIDELMEITRWVPTASNKQQLKWMVYSSRQEIRRLAGLTVDFIKSAGLSNEIVDAFENNEDIVLRSAPHLILVLGETGYFWTDAEAGIALTYLELYAHSMNLGTCWAGFFTRAANTFAPLIETLDLPENYRVCGGIMLGKKVFRQHAVPYRKKPDILWR